MSGWQATRAMFDAQNFFASSYVIESNLVAWSYDHISLALHVSLVSHLVYSCLEPRALSGDQVRCLPSPFAYKRSDPSLVP